MFRRGWEVQLKDGIVLNENQTTWKEIPKNQITRLTLHYDGRRWDLEDKQAYFVQNRASVVPGFSESFQIEQRTVGFYEGATKIYYTVDEFTGRFNMRAEDNS